MKEFVYQMPVKVCFGKNAAEKHLENELKNYGETIMLAYGGGSVKSTGVYDQITGLLEKAGKRVVELSGIPANPTYEKVLEGIALYKEENVDLILAVGGGSVVDCCKVIAAGTEVDEDIWELQFEQHKVPEKMGNFAVVLTLSGAGAEMDCLGAVTKESTHEKKTLVGPYARFVILDPAYLMTAPLPVFMPGVFDSLTHCMETYFGNAFNVSDLMNEGLMKDIVANMKKLSAGEDTLEVRSDLMWDSSLIQTFLFNVGKPGDFQGHTIENTLGAYSHGTHGKQLAVILPAYYRRIYKFAPDRFARFACEVMGVTVSGSDEEVAALGLDELETLIQNAGLASTFSALGYELTEDVAQAVSEKCGISAGSLHPLTRQEIFELLVSCK